MDAGIVPVKALTRANSRLSGSFSEPDRNALARALLDDCIAMCQSADILQWTFVSVDEAVLQLVERSGLRALREETTGLNEALSQGVADALERGAQSLTVLPVDVPLAWRGDIEDLLDTGATSDVVVVPSGRDGGTNALYMSPPDLIEPHFGSESLKAHIAIAVVRGYRCSVLSLPRVALDIDTIDDVDEFLSWPGRRPSRTGEVLERLTARA
ncbi:MAG: 2-phospho-L-lactate guanylyltransferase [Actinomycetota bacterium]|nr:2-phospho-L-lactate guanylyltransferase [Actinomycetota bacterium]